MHESDVVREATSGKSGPPVLVVHGIWDSARRIAPLVAGLTARGLHPVVSFDLVPNDGRAGIAVLAAQIAEQAEALRARSQQPRIDLVGFSMGALASRYFVQRLDGRERVRRFVSISGPHAGTYTAHALPLTGVRQMRPASAFLNDLAGDRDPWGSVEVHCIYTPFDLTILPAKSSLLTGARSVHRVPVLIHRAMLRDTRVLDIVARLLRAP
jgi:triacylglycerol lipase